MTATTAKTEAPVTTPDESTRPAEIEGRCNKPMTTVEGALDRCARAKDHGGDHVSHTSTTRAKQTVRDKAAAFAAWKLEHDPETKARLEAARAKKVATLQALADELGAMISWPKNA